MAGKIILTGTILGAIATAGAAYAAGENIVTSKHYVDTEVAKKQNDIGKQDTANFVVTYPTTVGGETGSREIVGEMGSSTSDTKLATRGAINTALNTKEDNITGTANNVVTYGANGNGLNSTGKAIYAKSGTYSAAQQAALIQAGDVNSGIAAGYNAHITCSDCGGAATCNTTNCLLYSINPLSTSTAYLPTNQQ